MKSKAHYKKCVELGVVPVPTLVCDENIDKDAVARLAAGGGNAEESSSEEDESDGEESEESGSEEHEAAQGLLSLSQRSASRLPGLLPSGRPTTYPYTLTLSPSTVCSTVTTRTSNTAPLSSQAAAVIQSELSHRYYFPSNRSVQENVPRTSVIIQSSKKSVSDDVEDVGATESQSNSSQPIDLTTKQIISPVDRRGKTSDILTPVSEPVFIQTIVQSMERLPVQGREWKSEAQGQMLQAYLTERHVMDSKMKLQYRVGSSKGEKNASEKEIQYLKQQDVIRSRNIELNGVATVTYTDPTKIQQNILEPRMKNAQDDLQLEMRDKIAYQSGERSRPFDKENALEPEKRNHFVIDLPTRSSPGIEPQSPRHFNIEMINRNSEQRIKSEIDRSQMFNAMKMMSEVENHNQNQETRPPSRETRLQSQDLRVVSSNQDFRLSSTQEFKTVNQEQRNLSSPGPPKIQEARNNQDQKSSQQLLEIPRVASDKSPQNPETRSSERLEVKQSMAESIKHSVARKMVVGGPGFRSPSPPGGSGKPQAEFLQPSSGPAPNYVR